MKYLWIAAFLWATAFSNSHAQKYLTKNGHISFYSEAPLENIEADNNQVTSIVDLETGEIVFSLLMKSFDFEKALMEEHFNEKYVHSDKYPKSTFKGQLSGLPVEGLVEGEPVKVTATGALMIHGVEKEISTEAELSMVDGKLLAKAVFPVTLADFDISIPGVVRDNIAKVVEVTVDMSYELYEKGS